MNCWILVWLLCCFGNNGRRNGDDCFVDTISDNHCGCKNDFGTGNCNAGRNREGFWENEKNNNCGGENERYENRVDNCGCEMNHEENCGCNREHDRSFSFSNDKNNDCDCGRMETHNGSRLEPYIRNY